MKDQTVLISYITLFTGIGLLGFTFISAYIFLATNPSINTSSNLVDVFGSSLAPLIEASIRIMYLGVMGWIGSGLTLRGVQLITQLKRLEKMDYADLSSKPVQPTAIKENKQTNN
ncbi:MAG: hypothetical protein WC325_11780 [Candidatus Bathyarchaeia archaeon]